MALPGLLVLCHRMPYPPNVDNRDRFYHLVRYLRVNFNIYLAAIIDDLDDWQHVKSVHSLCKDSVLFLVNPVKRRLSSLSALFGNQPLQVHYYKHAVMQKWVRQCIELQPVHACLVLSPLMGQYVLSYSSNLRTVIDFSDYDVEDLTQQPFRKFWAMQFLYRREAKRISKFSHQLAEQSTSAVFRSAQQALLFRQQSQSLLKNITYIEDGIDVDYFDPRREYPNPFENDSVLVFYGPMSDPAYANAANWFSEKVWPLVLTSVPQTKFYIVSTTRLHNIRGLSKIPGVVIVDQASDVRPYIRHAKLAVAPMLSRIEQCKPVLEIFAMETPLLYSKSAALSLGQLSNEFRQVADDEQAWVNQCCMTLQGGNLPPPKSRDIVLKQHTWDARLSNYLKLLKTEP